MLDATAHLEWQRHTRPEEGLAFTWEQVPAAVQYVLLAGLSREPVPPIGAILRGASPNFTYAEIPYQYFGAVDVGTPAGEEHQYSLVAKLDGDQIVPVSNVQYMAGFEAPQDRDYYAVEPQLPSVPRPAALSGAVETPVSPVTPPPPIVVEVAPRATDAASAVAEQSPVLAPDRNATVMEASPAQPLERTVADVAAPAPAIAPVSLATPVPAGAPEDNRQESPPSSQDAAAPGPVAEFAPVVIGPLRSDNGSKQEPGMDTAASPALPLPATAIVTGEASPEVGAQAPVAAESPAASRPAGESGVSPPEITAPGPLTQIGQALAAGRVAVQPDGQQSEAEGAAPALETQATPSPLREVREGDAARDASSPTDPALAALLDEAELWLRPPWVDDAQAAQLLDQAAALAPADPRLRELQERLRAAQQDGGANVDHLLQQARQRLEAREYWQAVDVYEQILSRQPDHQEAQQGLARARALGRWAAQMAAAGGDAERLRRIGNDYAKLAPDLASRAYAAAFAAQPAIVSLNGWLLALARSNQMDDLVATARQSVLQLRQCGRVRDDPAQESALDVLQRQVEIGEVTGIGEAISQVTQALVISASQQP